MKSDLTPPRKRLIELMQEMNFGRIKDLQVRDSEPVFDPPPRILRQHLFGKQSGPNAMSDNDGFVLKRKATELFDLFDRERSLLIEELIIDNGLPVRMTWTGGDLT